MTLVPILLCGGGCLIMCVLMMRGTHRGSPATEQTDGGTTRAGEITSEQD